MRRRRPVLVIAFSSTEQALAAEALFTNGGPFACLGIRMEV